MRIQVCRPSLVVAVGYRHAVNRAVAEISSSHRSETNADNGYKYADLEYGQGDDRIDTTLAIRSMQQASGSHAYDP